MWFRRKEPDKTCPICNSDAVTEHRLPYPMFDGLTFERVKGKNFLSECHACGYIWRPVTDYEADMLEARFRDPGYPLCRRASSVMLASDGKPLDRIGVQADMLAGQFPLHNPNVLDIGCGNGELLAELRRRTYASNPFFMGYDVAHRTMVDPEVKFEGETLWDIGEKFDLIIMSHNLEYVRGMHVFMEHIRSRLSHENTTLYIQVPDLARNPCSLLCYEQLNFFNIENLSALLGRYGFWEVEEKSHAFPRDLCLFAWRGANNFSENGGTPKRLYAHLHQIGQLCHWLNIYSRRADLCVLGTTIMAAYAHYVLGGKIKCFVDENPLRQGMFQGKPVVAPECLYDKDMVLIPMVGARRLAIRMARQYTASFEAYETMDSVDTRVVA